MRASQPIFATRAFELGTDDWHGYFEAIGADGARLVARVIVAPERADDEDGAMGRPLHAIRYDADADEIEIHVGRPAPSGALLRYFVSAPRSIHVQERLRGKLIAVDDASGVRTLIHVSYMRRLMRYALPWWRSMSPGAEPARLGGPG
jgi:hypothetical protein